ncbi:hypothetical protein [uncultured Clostridium sp.]|uniref:hypothetical protein n=1 Tax=uncultured Clostridium sp. TaxID=59620 RepID=UPI0028EF53D4|nr:hypothetical protein [uncultured Clostridium sp.]
MKNSEQLDQLLKRALSPTVEPSEDLNQKIIDQLKENNIMKPVYKKRISVALIAATLTIAMSVTVFAAWHLLNTKQIAEHLGDQRLAHAFEDKNAIEINKSIVSGGYNFTLLGIVSGKGLSDFRASVQDIHPDRTYAVVSIAKQDGSKMPDTQDEEYGKVPFFISPLIKGQKPWLVNIASMNGGYSEFVMDGIMYRLIECDGVEMFSDRGLYLSISTSSFYDVNAFNYNEKTGEISPNTNYNGANALFNLPLDIRKADYEKAEKYLKELLKEPKVDSTVSEEAAIDWEKKFANGVAIPESIKKVTYDKNGFACYEYEGYKLSIAVDSLFEKGKTDVSKIVSINGEDDNLTAIQLSRDANGVITGRILKLN